MANKKFSELEPASTSPDIESLLCISELTAPATYESRKITIEDFKSEISSGTSGTYTPTATIMSNVDTATPTIAQWYRVGNIVTVAGGISIDQTATGSWQVDLSLPVASNFAAVQDVNGVISTNANMGTAYAGGFLQADPTNDRAAIRGISGINTPTAWKFIFSYEVI
jgi:hypothetical protein